MAADRRWGAWSCVGLVFLVGWMVVTALPARGQIRQDVGLLERDLPPAPNRVIVRMEGVTDVESAAKLLPSPRYRITRSLMPHVGIFLVGLEGVTVDGAIAELSAKAFVRYAHPDHQLQLRSTVPNDPYFYKQWSMKNTGENPLAYKEDGSCQSNCSQVALTSCAGSCGDYSEDGCWCDGLCNSDPSECCSDYYEQCGDSCEGSCGGVSPDGCWCDANCVNENDCCPDYETVCGLGPSLPTGACGCTVECVNQGNCCWDACLQCGNCTGLSGVDVDATYIWDSATDATGSNEVVVAIIDGGVDYLHNDLHGNIWHNMAELFGVPGYDDDQNGYVDDDVGWDALTNNGFVGMGDGHGTKVAGIVGASGNNGLGITGVGWNARMMCVTNGVGTSFVSTTVASYEYIRKNKELWLETAGAKGANVVVANSSFGMDGACDGQYLALNDAYDELGAVGVLSVIAVANAHKNQDVEGDIPAGCASDFIISVTSTDANDSIVYEAAFGQFTVDLGAPGEDIHTTMLFDTYETGSGTSLAAPLVAGSIALAHANAASCFQEYAIKEPAAAALWMKGNILDNVDPLSSLEYTTLSGGRLNTHKAVFDMITPEASECGDGCCVGAETYVSCPSDCVLVGTGSCCLANGTPGCADPDIQACVCDLDPVCCSVGWDSVCAEEVETFCGSCGGDCCEANPTPGCSNSGCEICLCATDAFCCDLLWDVNCAGVTAILCSDECGECAVCGDGVCGPAEFVSNCPSDCAGSGSCCVQHPGSGCGDLAVQTCVCENFPAENCCTGNWSLICSAAASISPCNACNGDCCAFNGTPGCEGTACEVCVCNVDAFCCEGVWDDVCGVIAGGQCTSSCSSCDTCGNGYCGPGENACGCSEDCGSVCGDGCCNGNEDSCSCPGDCGVVCGDGCCNGNENTCSCPGDCTALCGDGCCNGNEGSCSCPGDCGVVCGDGCCNSNENPCSCPWDCTALCGDGCCSPAESVGSCPADCAGTGSCCLVDPSPGCQEASVQQCVCAIDSSCCGSTWSLNCVSLAAVCGSCTGSCCNAQDPTPGCYNQACTACVCQFDSLCCLTTWDAICAQHASNICLDSCSECDSCGNGSCGPNESTCSCASDCGSSCGDGCCSGGETGCSCPADCGWDCCGDGICGDVESCSTCAVDCGCNDDDPCTIDTCLTGNCTSAPIICDDSNPCTNDVCQSGTCIYNSTSEPCNDGNACSENDLCLGGICQGVLKDCSDGDACTSDSCSDGNCINAPFICEDGNDCTNDTCQGGQCFYINNINACVDGDACTDNDQCLGGNCKGVPKNCSDGDACTVDICSNGGCSNTPIICEDGNACTSDLCQEGECLFPNNPIACDDEDACTEDDQCLDGACKGAAKDCDDQDACTVDSCSGGNCTNTTILCDDSNPCTDEACEAGICVSSNNTNSCDDEDLCTSEDLCVEGTCQGIPKDCADADFCTLDSCVAGDCVNAEVVCDDDNPCTTDICLNGLCFFPKNTAPCNDGDDCTSGDQCADGVCAGVAMVCEDTDPCTLDGCSDGACFNTPVVCDDGNPCTSDLCMNGFCLHPNNFIPCDDDDACTSDDQCSGGACGGVPVVCEDAADPCDDNSCIDGDCVIAPLNCDDDNPCTADLCMSGFCFHPSNALACDDEDACTDDDQCSGGACAGDPKDCDDGNPCTSDLCVDGVCDHLGVDGCCVASVDCGVEEECVQNQCEPTCGPISLCLDPFGDATGDGSTDVVDIQCGIVVILWELSAAPDPIPVCVNGDPARTDLNCDGTTAVPDVLLCIGGALDSELDALLDEDGNGCPDACENQPNPTCLP